MNFKNAHIMLVAYIFFFQLSFGTEDKSSSKQPRTVIDYPYQEDQKSLPQTLQFDELRTGTKNKFEAVKALAKLFSSNDVRKELFDIQMSIERSFGERKFDLTDEQKDRLRKWDEQHGTKIAAQAKILGGSDFCQSPLNGKLRDHLWVEGLKVYLYSSLLSDNVNYELQRRLESVVVILHTLHECTPSLIETIISTAFRLSIVETIKVLSC